MKAGGYGRARFFKDAVIRDARCALLPSGRQPSADPDDPSFGEGSALPREDGSAPHERFHVKGNDDSGLYHTKESPSYNRTGAEVW